jgi:hypothetical protein
LETVLGRSERSYFAFGHSKLVEGASLMDC